MSKVLLINPDIPMERSLIQIEQFPNGALLQLGTILENKGHTVRIVHMMADGINLQQLSGIVKDFQPKVVGLTAITFQSRTLRETSKVVKSANSKTTVVAGGPHISALISINYPIPEEYPNIDYFVGGEGDFVLDEIINQKPTSNVLIAKPISTLIIPPVNMELIDINRFAGAYPPGPRPGMFIMGARGCPFKCTFCSRSVFGSTMRYREPMSIIDDVERLSKDWGIKEVFFQDDTFNLNRKWAEDILNLIIIRKLTKKLYFRTQCRVNERLVDLDLLKLIKEAGFWIIFYGVESGNQMMLDRMNKGTKVEEIKRAFRLTQEAGIKTQASFIVGLPGETRETIQDSIKLWKEIKPDWSSFTRAIPFPGTELYKEAKQAGHLLIDSFDDIEIDKVMCRTEALTGEEIENYAVALGNIVGRKKLWKLLKSPLDLLKILYDLKNISGIKRGIKQVWQILHKTKL